MHNCCKTVQKDMKHLKRTWKNYYILKMDIRKYFQNIDKKILLKIIEKRIKDDNLIWLIKKILDSRKGEKGIPIGNYTSQMFANIYLNEVY